MGTIRHTRGDTFSKECTATLDGVTPRDLTGVTIACQMKHMVEGTVFTFSTTVTDAAAGQFTLNATATQTRAWELGRWKSDIEYTTGEVVESNGVFYVEVAEDITNAD